jgi:hypothetical protein
MTRYKVYSKKGEVNRYEMSYHGGKRFDIVIPQKMANYWQKND